ncbi:hypothetical protein [Aeromicrobium erythreum]|uniref:Uncharacterized protein n=1 Tax=Aeromicrobium erythreum TaxID=2041 RepID=A0A0U4CRH9_9ACTN|nr:hypothetical protein [Aeromicrobium erythreum]ALX05212.1 hypothetical protein AERYTH_11100 [Aeromicrobium erythreum]
MIDPTITEALVRLAEVAARNTAGAVQTRVQTARAAKQNENTINELAEIINQLVDDRMELMSIANVLREQLVAQTITTEEISYITEKLIPTAETLMSMSGENDKAALEALKMLVSVETLTVLQLVGFNFKAAVGEPLTEVVSEFVSSLAPKSRGAGRQSQGQKRR